MRDVALYAEGDLWNERVYGSCGSGCDDGLMEALVGIVDVVTLEVVLVVDTMGVNV